MNQNAKSHPSFWNCSTSRKKKQNFMQEALAERLGMSIHTMIQAEQGYSNPKLETVVILCRELNISLDAIIFSELAVAPVSKNVVDFFSGKTETKVQKYISLCQQVDSSKSEK